MRNSLPRQVSEASFNKALDGFGAIAGKVQVKTSAADLDSYRDPFALGMEESDASAAVTPASVEEVQAIVRVANEYRIPLWTVSTGRNFAYGGAAPRLPGSVILDLKRLNRIIEVNEDLAYAMVEPGVTYFDLYAHLRNKGIKLWIDPPAPGWGSVVGNTLERGFGYTPYGDHAALQCGMEVVLANGELIRTGMGAMTDNVSWPLYKPGYGPSYDAMFMQSNFGIVTKMGVWLMPQPDTALLCTAKFHNESDLELIVDTLRPLRLNQTIQNNAVIEGPVRWAAGVSTRDQWYQGDGAMPRTAIETMIRELGIGWWNLRFGLYGPSEIVDANYRIVKKALAKILGAELSAKKYHHDEPTGGGDKLMVGIPNLAAFQMLNWRGGNGAHIDFSPICPATGRDAVRQYQMVQARANESGVDYYGGFTAGTRHLHHVFAAIFDRNNIQHCAQVATLFKALIADARKAGYGEYRTHLHHMDQVANQYDFNSHALLRMSEAIKDALDPAGILSPGKQGIWPRALRDFKP